MAGAHVVEYLRQAARALDKAHAIGIVHRDLKPENLFVVQRDGWAVVKVLDFGISKAAMPGAMDAGVTTTSAVLGSPMYMAPEQMIASREVDGRTDVWALGVVLYQLLTGHGPFNGTTMTELCARILQEPHAPVRASRADVPPEIEAVIARCLEKDRTRRFASVADLAEAVAPFGGQQAARSAERARRLIPRTERAVVVPPGATPEVYAQAMAPYAATNPSWSATRARSGASTGIWVAVVFALAGVIGCVAAVVFFFAARAREASPPAAVDTTVVAAPPPVTTAAADPSLVELTPLRTPAVATATATATSTMSPPPARTGTQRVSPPIHAPPPPPPTATTPSPKPDIF